MHISFMYQLTVKDTQHVLSTRGMESTGKIMQKSADSGVEKAVLVSLLVVMAGSDR